MKLINDLRNCRNYHTDSIVMVIYESCMARNKTTKLAVLFVLVGALMIVVPMLIEQVYARTYGGARTFPPDRGTTFTNVKWHLDAGKWVRQATLHTNGHLITWETTGRGVFGGLEKGWISADFGRGAHVKFFRTNPDFGKNTCSIEARGFVVNYPCDITPSEGPTATASYIVRECGGRIACNG
jgi:hypothetical protein